MKKDIILSGVGGQGILSIATVIGKAEPARRRRAVQPAHQRPIHRFGPHSHRKMRPHHLPGTDGSTALPPLPQPRRLAGDQ